MKRSFSLLSFSFVILLCSCSNFLNGSDLKDQLGSEISYASEKYVSVTISADSDAVKSIVPASGEYLNRYKKGDSVKLKVEPRNTYVFSGWACEPPDSVIFADSKMTETEAEVSVNTENIKIFPVLSLIPAVESFYPPLEQSGFPQDTTIVIKFNKPVDLSSFCDFKNIFITSDSVSLISAENNFFQNPVAVDEKTLEIKTVKNKNIIPPDSESVLKDIKVSLTLNEIKDKDNIEFSEQNPQFIYRINETKDSKPPVIISALKAQKALPDLLLQNINPEDIPLESFETYSQKSDLEKVFEQHHVGGKIRLSAQFKDEESGIKKFRIKEKLLRKTDSTLLSEAEDFLTEYYFNDDLPETFSYNADTKTWSYFEEYSFYTADDGVIDLNIEIEDFAGNVTSLTPETNPLEVIKDVQKIDAELSRIGSDFVTDSLDEFEVMISYNSLRFPFYIEYNGTPYYKYCNITNPEDYDTYLNKIYYQLFISTDEMNWTSVKEEKQGILKSDSRSFPSYIYKIKRNTHKNLYLKTLAIDCVGNMFESNKYCIQKSDKIINVKDCSEVTKNCMEITFNENPSGYYFVFIKEDSPDSSYFALSPTNSSMLTFGLKDDPVVELPYNDFIKENTDYLFYVVPGINPVGIYKTNYYADSPTCSEVAEKYKQNPLNILCDSQEQLYFLDKTDSYSNKKDIVTTSLYGSLSEPFIYNKNKIGKPIPDSAVPRKSQVIITEKPVTPDSYIHEGTVSYTEDFTEDPDYKYIIREVNSDGSVIHNFMTKNIYSVKIYETYFEVAVFDGKGNEKTSERISYTFQGDITPPSVTADLKPYSDYTNSTAPSSTKVLWKVSANSYDSLSEIKEADMTQIKEISYLLSNNSSINSYNYNNYKFYPCITNDKKFSIQLDDRNFSYAYIVIKDQTGNTHFEKTEFEINYLNKFYDYCLQDNKLNLSIPDEYNDSNNRYKCYPDSIRFILTDLKTDFSINAKAIDKKSSLELDLNEIPDNTFVKIESEVYNLPFKYSSTTYYTKTAYFPYTTYFCPAYEKTKKACILKNVIKGDLGLSILCDQVAFAHTLYSVNNYGSDKELKNYAEWETKGYETDKPVIQDSSFTYEIPETPCGYWYTTIIHFADGTVYQTTPIKK